MKAIALLFAAVLAWVATPAASAQGPDMRLRIELENATLRVGEPLICRVIVENVGTNTLVVNSRMLVNRPTGPHELAFEITGPDKRAVPFTTKIRASSESSQYALLLPKQLVGLLYDLTEDHELNQRGQYTVRAYYENRHDPSSSLNLPSAWKGTLESNRVSFTLE